MVLMVSVLTGPPCLVSEIKLVSISFITERVIIPNPVEVEDVGYGAIIIPYRYVAF